MSLHAAGDDPLGEVPRVVLERLDAAGLQHLDVVVNRDDVASENTSWAVMAESRWASVMRSAHC